LESLERRVIFKIIHIQQAKLKIGKGAYHPREKLEEVGDISTQEELIEANLSEEVTEKQFSQEETTELESATQ
jgi:topoisomerase IA-like protein